MGIFVFSYRDSSLPKVSGPLLLGNFDGLHLGHQMLIEKAKEMGDPSVLLLDPPFQREKKEKVLTTLFDKIRLFGRYGVNNVFVLKTDPSFFRLSKEDFMTLVLKKLQPSSLVVGEDYSFGALRSGKASDLKKEFQTFAYPLLKEDGVKVGSSLIKTLLLQGEVSKAASFLGRPYEICGKVEKGFQNGRKIKFPTANLDPFEYVLPTRGVYCGSSFLRGECYKSLINVGEAPTVGKLSHNIVEVYLDGFEGDCYEETLYVDFAFYLRQEKKFSSLEDLKEELQRNLEEMRKRL